jgi:predicted dithiol-disulfide oxidoreductase (DUF899 family)
MADGAGAMDTHAVVSHDEWIAARSEFLTAEKEFSRRREELSRQRRDLPWERVEKSYVFEGPSGSVTLSDLFAGNSQLIVYHFMFTPGDDEGCPHCSFWADNFDGIDVHLAQRDVRFVAIARAPLDQIAPFKQRMGWNFTWLSSFGTDFNYDFNVSFTPEQLAAGEDFYNYRRANAGMPDLQGISIFYRDEHGDIFHTYSAFARGIDMVNGAYQFLDLVPKGRDEAGHDNPQFWVRHHDRYDDPRMQ